MTSLYELMMRPKASEADMSRRRLVTKLSDRSPMLMTSWPGSLINTGTLQSSRPRAPQKYLMTKSCMMPW